MLLGEPANAARMISDTLVLAGIVGSRPQPRTLIWRIDVLEHEHKSSRDRKAGSTANGVIESAEKIARKGFDEASVEQICETGLISFSILAHSLRPRRAGTTRFIAQFIYVPIRLSYGLGNLTPKRSATTSGASRE
jgi:hypothetical protein